MGPSLACSCLTLAWASQHKTCNNLNLNLNLNTPSALEACLCSKLVNFFYVCYVDCGLDYGMGWSDVTDRRPHSWVRERYTHVNNRVVGLVVSILSNGLNLNLPPLVRRSTYIQWFNQFRGWNYTSRGTVQVSRQPQIIICWPKMS